jgi:hypothetical protein
LEVGDTEFRYGGLVHLGGDAIGIALHYYEVTDAANLVDADDNRAYWSLSVDRGVTWSDPVELPPFDEDEPNFAVACEPVVWKNYVWIPCYSAGNGRHFTLRAPVADVIANTATWLPFWIQSFGNETGFIRPVANDDAKLYVAGRGGVSDGGNRVWSITSAQADIPPSSWTQESAAWEVPDFVGNQPQIVQTANGRFVTFSRGPVDALDPATAPHLTMWTCVSETLLGEFTRDGLVPVTRSRKPAWNDHEKAMYSCAVPMGGDLLAVLFATEADWQGEADPLSANYELGYRDSSQGTWASVWFGFFAAGAGQTPMGAFSAAAALPAVPSIMDIPGLRVALLASNVVDVGGGSMSWECPISGLRWTADAASKPGYSATGSANGGQALTNTNNSAKRLVFDAESGTLPTDNFAVYFLCKHATGSGAWNCIVPVRCQINDSGNWHVGAPFDTKVATMDNAPITASSGGACNVGPGADTWRVLSYRQADKVTLTTLHLTLAGFTQILNQSGQNRGWNGSLTAILVFDRNTTPREHAAIIAQLQAL